ncbi:MAG: PadR family transcriptional regulator [Bacteroidales bacterium]
MNIENTKMQMRKGVLEYCILSIIKRGEAYPIDILKELKDSGMNIFEGTLYPLLSRLKNAELLSYRWEESQSGPPRKYFSLTEEGVEFHGRLKETWDDLNKAIDTITRKSK